jgi:ankyrin repeat protein
MGHDDVVINSLLRCTSDVDKDSLSKLRCHDGKTLLHRAAETGNLNAVQIYSDVINVEVVDNDGNTPLHLACDRGFLKIVRFLIEKPNVNPCIKNYFGCTPLHLSSLGGHLDVTEYLIKQPGVSINEQDTINYTPLHYACAGSNIEVVLHLLLSGADPFIGNMLSDDLVYPEHFAIKHKHDEVAAMLNQWKKKNQVRTAVF